MPKMYGKDSRDYTDEERLALLEKLQGKRVERDGSMTGDTEVLARIVVAARAGHALTYDDAWGDQHVPQRVIGDLLERLNDAAHRIGKPIPSVLVVKADGSMPADGFFAWAEARLGKSRDQAREFRRTERQKCFAAAAHGELWGLNPRDVAGFVATAVPRVYSVCKTKGCIAIDHQEPERIGPLPTTTPCDLGFTTEL